MFQRLKKDMARMEIDESYTQEPVAKEDMEKLIKLMHTAHDVGAWFELELQLPIGSFSVDSDEYTGIKIMPKTKTDKERVTISYKDALLSNDTVIDLENVLGISFVIRFCDINAKIK